MRRNALPLLFFVTLGLSACLKNNEEPEIYCDSPTVNYIRFNWHDGEGNDLIFGEEAPYSLEDITFRSDYNGQLSNAQQMHLRIDSVYSDTLSVLMPYMGNGNLSLGELPPDKLSFRFESLSNEPCAGSQLAELLVNDSVYCAPCTPLERVILTK